jgi:multicomponent Na+:H+ antiporter subunit D
VTLWSHPAWPCLAGAALAGVLPPSSRRAVTVVAPVLALALAWALPEGGRGEAVLLGQPLVWIRSDALGRAFAIIFALLAGLGAVYGLDGSRRLHVTALAVAGAGLGIVLAGDWITLYASWELLAVGSFVLITDGRTPRAAGAALRYLLVHLTGGALLLAGIVVHLAAGGDPTVGPLDARGPGLLVLLGFAVNAAVPPLHAWLTDAYPESSPAGSVFLSAFATKAAVYAIVRVFAGTEALVWAGAGMALYGVVFAVLENNVRRLLAYHIVSQVGYMVAGAGLGSALALAGAVAHAFCHILYKGLLFMAAGAVVRTTGRERLTDLGGLAPRMRATLLLYMVGALSISGAPLLSGFVSKAMVVSAADEAGRWGVALLLGLASVGTFLSVGLKLPVLAFGGPDRGLRPGPVPPAALAAMAVTAGLCVLLGVAPGLLYRLLPGEVRYAPYTTEHTLMVLQLLLGTALGFILVEHRRLHGPARVTRDFDRAYRAAGRWVAQGLGRAVARSADGLEAVVLALAARTMARVRSPAARPVGYAVLLVVAALGLGLTLFKGFR